jgi:hypothetical protein
MVQDVLLDRTHRSIPSCGEVSHIVVAQTHVGQLVKISFRGALWVVAFAARASVRSLLWAPELLAKLV